MLMPVTTLTMLRAHRKNDSMTCVVLWVDDTIEHYRSCLCTAFFQSRWSCFRTDRMSPHLHSVCFWAPNRSHLVRLGLREAAH